MRLVDFVQAIIGMLFAVLGAVLITDVCNKLFSNDIALIISLLLSFTWGYSVFPLVGTLWDYFNNSRSINIWK